MERGFVHFFTFSSLPSVLSRIQGQRERLESLLRQKWARVFACDWPKYKELTLEFHSTFMYDDFVFDSVDAVSFSLGRRVYEMSIPQFAVSTSFYTEDEVLSPRFSSSFRGASKRNRDFGLSKVDLSEFWGTIADSPFSTSMVESEIRDPVLRYIHKVLACTVVGRYSGEEKVNWIDLFCLYCMVRGREANMACVMAQSLARGRRDGGRARLDMGPYIYRIAEFLGVFDTYRPDLITLGPLTTAIDLRDLQRADICERDDPPRMDGYHEQHKEWHFTDQRRQEDAMRYLMTSLHIDIPEFFLAPDEHEERGGGDDED
ncbi:hypothetical protein R6Q57_030096 [Mikania cordata]